MELGDVRRICVVGAGAMGHQISLQCAISGYETCCTDISEEMLKKADAFVDSYLPGRVKKGRMTEEQAKRARKNVRFTANLEDALKTSDFVIEAVPDVLDLKRKVFHEMDKLAPPHAILATNSSQIVSSEIAHVTTRPHKVINVHFFNPVLVMKLVEVVQGPHVSDETAMISIELCRRLEKIPVHLKREVKGFLLNRILGAVLNEARWLLEMGVASVEDIDNACVHGAGHPMGPFRLNDLTGIDVTYTMAMEKFKITGDPGDLPQPCIVERYARGEYGRKTGKGWYEYKDTK